MPWFASCVHSTSDGTVGLQSWKLHMWIQLSPPLTFSCTVTQHLIYITSTCELAPRKQTHYAHTQPHRHTQTRWSVKKDLHSGTASPHISARPHTRKQKQEINVTCNFYRADLSVCDRPNPIAAAGLTGLTWVLPSRPLNYAWPNVSPGS